MSLCPFWQPLPQAHPGDGMWKLTIAILTINWRFSQPLPWSSHFFEHNTRMTLETKLPFLGSIFLEGCFKMTITCLTSMISYKCM